MLLWRAIFQVELNKTCLNHPCIPKGTGQWDCCGCGSFRQSSLQELRCVEIHEVNLDLPIALKNSANLHSSIKNGMSYQQRCFSFPGEASASTMWDNNAWIFFYDNSTEGEPPFLIQDFIHAFQPNAKLIIMLRDPVER